FFLAPALHHHDPHSFPTRRSSDLPCRARKASTAARCRSLAAPQSIRGDSQSEALVGEVRVFEACPRVEDLIEPRADALGHVFILLEQSSETIAGILHRLHRRLLDDQVSI